MEKLTLTVLDTAHIQDYIFGSNRLQENIGASELVERATKRWAYETLDKMPLQHNVKNIESDDDFDTSRRIEDDLTLQAEVLYAGGGNTAILFRDKESAINFTKQLSKRILKEAPGLELIAAHDDKFDWDSHHLGDRLMQLLNVEIGKKKSERQPSLPLLGLGVTAACESTGLVASRSNAGLKLKKEPLRRISSEIAAKLQARDEANKRLEKMFSGVIPLNYQFPHDMDDLGRLEGEESYVAVVHADGNRIGSRFKKLAEAIKTTYQKPEEGNRKHINAARALSKSIHEAGKKSLEIVMDKIVYRIQGVSQRGHYLVGIQKDLNDLKKFNPDAHRSLPLQKRDDGKILLPIRPLVFGGDDLTLVCNGQIGLSVAELYLETFEAQALQFADVDDLMAEDKKLRGRAGIAIVKMHYPFSRAYQLSEQLAREAKKYIKELGQDDCTVLDWHFATSGLSGALKQIRDREYKRPNGAELVMRPVTLKIKPFDQSGRWWEKLKEVLYKFQNEEWQMKNGEPVARNKIIRMREPLRQGGQAVNDYRLTFGLPALPEIIPDEPTHTETGWFPVRCGYFDVIELMDHYLQLE